MNRPGHADQLHLDLWWRGQNIALDAGTYLYNAAPPWDNALARSLVHNTVTVNGLDQMTRAGRFLWLDWAQASRISRKQAEDGSWERGVAEHTGYRKLGVAHRRVVTAYRENRWLVEDSLLADTRRRLPVIRGWQSACIGCCRIGSGRLPGKRIVPTCKSDPHRGSSCSRYPGARARHTSPLCSWFVRVS
jgi:hypothetical protein